MKTLQCFILIVFIMMTMLENVFASNLNNIYASPQTTQNNIKTYSNPISTLSKNSEQLMKQGSKNYGQYATVNKRTNPVRFDNPYNALNDKYISAPSTKTVVSAPSYDGDAVRFKVAKDGNLYGYDKYGRKVGIYKINKNGTTTQYSTQGHKMGTFR